MKDTMYYQPSGKVPPMGWAIMIGGTILTALLVGHIYAYATWFIPFIYLNAILTGLAGASVGFVMRYLVKYGKIRNPNLAKIMGIVGGVLVLYVQWGVWVGLYLDVANAGGSSGAMDYSSNQVFALLTSPGLLWELITEISEYGSWSLAGDEAVSGIFLWIVWLIEAAIILGAAFFLSLSQRTVPFDEANEDWARELELPPRLLPIREPVKFVKSLESQDYGMLKEQAFRQDKMGTYAGYKLYHAKGDHKYYLSASNFIYSIDKDGKDEYEENIVVENIKIDPMMAQDFRELVKRSPVETQPAEKPENPVTPPASEQGAEETS